MSGRTWTGIHAANAAAICDQSEQQNAGDFRCQIKCFHIPSECESSDANMSDGVAYLGPGHHSDLAVCMACGTSFRVDYLPIKPGRPIGQLSLFFAHCTVETPGTLIWYDDGDNPIEMRRDVQPMPGSEFPDLTSDICPQCKAKSALVVSLPKHCECHKGILKKVANWQIGFSETEHVDSSAGCYSLQSVD